jgi:hypothetical protein
MTSKVNLNAKMKRPGTELRKSKKAEIKKTTAQRL